MSVYVVSCEWFDKNSDKEIKPTTYYFFASAKKALNFANNIAWNKNTYIKCGKPMDVYLYKLKKGKVFDKDNWLDQRYITAWQDLDERASFRFRL